MSHFHVTTFSDPPRGASSFEDVDVTADYEFEDLDEAMEFFIRTINFIHKTPMRVEDAHDKIIMMLMMQGFVPLFGPINVCLKQCVDECNLDRVIRN